MNTSRLNFASLFSAVAVAGLTLACTVSPASAILIVPTDKLIVKDSYGTPVFTALADELTETSDPNHIYMIMDPFLADPNQYGNATVLNEGGLYSDIFGVVRMTTLDCLAMNPNYVGIDGQFQYFLAFNSGDITSPPSAFGTPQHFFEESVGTPPGTFNATMYLTALKQSGGFTATFTSDVEAVPEGGATLGFFALALAGLGLSRGRLQLLRSR